LCCISDKAWDYSGSCGKCKEVKCKNTGLKDGYGSWLDRHVCRNDYSSVVVMVTDTCPCYYAANYASNKRWCCMDTYHLDMSVWAYEKVCCDSPLCMSQTASPPCCTAAYERFGMASSSCHH